MEKHPDQIEHYTCPICGAGIGNDLDGTVEHDCPLEEQYAKDMETNDRAHKAIQDEVARCYTHYS